MYFYEEFLSMLSKTESSRERIMLECNDVATITTNLSKAKLTIMSYHELSGGLHYIHSLSEKQLPIEELLGSRRYEIFDPSEKI